MGWQQTIPGGFTGWEDYYQAVSGEPPRETTVLAAERWEAEHGRSGFAVDLACGEGRDTVELLRRGWTVLAIDSEPLALAWLEKRDDLVGRDRLETRLAAMEDTGLPPADLVNASFALPFCPPERFETLWERITGALGTGGRFAGQIFGPDDDWADPGLTILDRPAVEALFAGFDFERMDEINRDGKDVRGIAKHWHIFHIVARRR